MSYYIHSALLGTVNSSNLSNLKHTAQEWADYLNHNIIIRQGDGTFFLAVKPSVSYGCKREVTNV